MEEKERKREKEKKKKKEGPNENRKQISFVLKIIDIASRPLETQNIETWFKNKMNNISNVTVRKKKKIQN